jgi:hypothetical protein
MASATIRIRPQTHAALKQIAEITGESVQDALDKAVEERRRKVYLEGLNADYAALRRDPKASAEFDADNALWDRTSGDGLEDS